MGERVINQEICRHSKKVSLYKSVNIIQVALKLKGEWQSKQTLGVEHLRSYTVTPNRVGRLTIIDLCWGHVF